MYQKDNLEMKMKNHKPCYISWFKQVVSILPAEKIKTELKALAKGKGKGQHSPSPSVTASISHIPWIIDNDQKGHKTNHHFIMQSCLELLILHQHSYHLLVFQSLRVTLHPEGPFGVQVFATYLKIYLKGIQIGLWKGNGYPKNFEISGTVLQGNSITQSVEGC
ncbi:uncharacterized protein BJ212DRAFT_1297313 [Suillus subaureus]|uniref:Uncharacterized protein n=1 Tax=Suillus subaureus TaxID=48587 RepID=A0A9P7EID4_9AGAM|nr:uncharacterized protein BJ212DRAFT_1297313 [Suillus subaureus]KAG1822074.1 hypothetical protein BJ212DRAFT_1297313 [Suillus subaureus]